MKIAISKQKSAQKRVFAIPSAKSVARINQRVKKIDLEAAELKYDLTFGVGGDAMGGIAGNRPSISGQIALDPSI